MPDWVGILGRHGYTILAAFVFLEAVGLPLPAAVVLLATGAACAMRLMNPGLALLVGVGGIVLGDTLLFFVGRSTGWWFLGMLCRLAANPESCIFLSADSFYRRGRTTLVIAKFIPAINTMAPPLAGSMRMRFPQFLWLDTLGALLYVLAFGGVGYVFSGLLQPVLRALNTAGKAMEWLILAGIVLYAAYHLVLYWKHRVYRVVPRVQAEEVARRLGTEAANIVIADVRSHGYYDAGATRIQGSMRIEPARLHAILDELPRDKDIFLYCT